LSCVKMHTSASLNSETTTHTLQCPDIKLQAADKRSKWLTWKKLTSILVAVCFVTVLHFDTAPTQLRLGNSNRKLSEPAGPAENISTTVYLSPGPAGNMSSLVHLPVGLSENMSSRTHLPFGLTENISSQGYLSGKIFQTFVNTVCVCNPSSRLIFVYISETNIPTQAFISSSGSCACSSTLSQNANEGQEIGCWYARHDEQYSVPFRCQGGKFIYSRYSNFAGRYVCRGSPVVCRKESWCRPPCT